jgi:thioredoxin-like negative regulator of GroEL
MVGRTERLFSRGQRALSARDYAGAETSFRAALAGTPHDPHLHRYLADALVEQDRFAEAERELATAIELAPASFVVHLHHAILLLDAGEPARARAPAAAAATRAPGNRLVAGYVELVAWAADGGAPPSRLVELAGELPESFGARALLQLAAVTLETRGPRALADVLEPPPEPLGLPLGLWLGALRHRDGLRYAEALLRRERFDDAACVIAAKPALLRDARAHALLERARRGALRAVEGALAGAGGRGRGTLLLSRYDIENDLGDEDAVARTLAEWRDLYMAAGAPRRERHLAAAVLRRLAAVEVGRGRYKDALDLCAASRAARDDRETAGVEALARLGLGERRAARRAFAEFLTNALVRVDMCLAAAAPRSSA